MTYEKETVEKAAPGVVGRTKDQRLADAREVYLVALLAADTAYETAIEPAKEALEATIALAGKAYQVAMKSIKEASE